MKWPKIRIRRETIERTLIVCSAALVLLLSLKRGGTNGEPYEEPLEDIPQGEISVSSAQTADTRETVVYYEDGDGYLRGTALSALRTVFFGGEKQVYLRYRQKVDGEYRWVALAIVAGKRCESGCAQVAMVLSGANGSGHANRPSEPRGVDYDCDPLTGHGRAFPGVHAACSHKGH